MSMIRKHGCDYCLQTVGNNEGDQLHQIPLTRTPNGDKLLTAELCSTCLGEITAYALKLAAATRYEHAKRVRAVHGSVGQARPWVRGQAQAGRGLIMHEVYTQDDHVITILEPDEDGDREVLCDCGGFSEQARWSGQAMDKAMAHVLEHDMMAED